MESNHIIIINRLIFKVIKRKKSGLDKKRKMRRIIFDIKRKV
jgi:hypothetical protein